MHSSHVHLSILTQHRFLVIITIQLVPGHERLVAAAQVVRARRLRDQRYYRLDNWRPVRVGLLQVSIARQSPSWLFTLLF